MSSLCFWRAADAWRGGCSSGKSVLSKIREYSAYFTNNCGDPDFSLHHRLPCFVVEGRECDRVAGHGVDGSDTLSDTSSVNSRGVNSSRRHTSELPERQRIV